MYSLIYLVFLFIIFVGLKSIINALGGSMKMLGEVILLTVFVLLIFSLLALQLFMGTLLQKCVVDLDVLNNNVTDEYWHEFVQNSCKCVCKKFKNEYSGFSITLTCRPDLKIFNLRHLIHKDTYSFFFSFIF